jgi:peroxiredoxin
MSLTENLAAYAAKSAANFSPQTRSVFDSAKAEYDRRGVGDDALREGAQLPDATLLDPDGDTVSIRSFLETGPAIISFYRGSWCPYCNLELKAYQDMLSEIEAAGATLIAISPESPDRTVTAKEKNALTFPVLTDVNNAFAKSLGISFDYTEELRQLYGKFELDLEEINEGGGWALPVPATYVVAKDGTILLASIDRDYEKRLEPSDALAALSV